MTSPIGGFRFNPEAEIERLTVEFAEGKAQIWADADMPLQDKGPAIEQLWREFNRQREEIRSGASQGEAATGEEDPSPQRSRAPFLPRRRRPSWK